MFRNCVKYRTLCFITLIFLCLLTIISLRSIYRHYLPKELKRVDTSIKEKPENQSIWFIGDSRIARWPVNEFFNDSYSILNIGREGASSKQSYNLYLEHLNYSTPKYIFVQVGINDLKAIGVFPGKQNEISENVIENIKSILLLSKKNEIKPFYITIFPSGRVELKRVIFWNKKINSSINYVNEEIINFCKANDIKVFNSHDILADKNGKVKKSYQLDCLHINLNGYKQLNKEIQVFFKNNL